MVRYLLLISVLAIECGCHSTSPAAAFLNAGNVAAIRHDWEGAIEQFDEALRVKPQLLEALKGRGIAYEKLGKTQQALADYELLLELQANNDEIRIKVILLLLESENVDGALGRLPELKGRIADAEFFLLKGRVDLVAGDFKEAIQCLDRAVSLDSNSAFAWHFRGIALARLGKLSEGDYSFTKAIAIDNQFAAAYWQRFRVRTRLGQQELAEIDEQRAAQLDPRLTFAESSIGKNALETLQGSEPLQSLGRPGR